AGLLHGDIGARLRALHQPRRAVRGLGGPAAAWRYSAGNIRSGEDMSKRRRRGFIDVRRAEGRSTVARYADPTIADRIQRLKVDRDTALGRLNASHGLEVRDLYARQAGERRAIWDAFDKAKNKLLDRQPTTKEVAA